MAETTNNVFKKRPSQKKLMDKLNKERIKNTSARAGAAKKGATSDTLTQRMGDARKSRGPYPVPAKRAGSAVVPYKKPGTDVVPYKEPQRGVVKYEPKPNVGTAAGNIAKKTFGRGMARVLGPVGALVGMTKPAGAPEESSSIKRDRSYGPLMKGNAKEKNGTESSLSVANRSQFMKNPTSRPYDAKTSPGFKGGKAVTKKLPGVAGGHGAQAFNTERSTGLGKKPAAKQDELKAPKLPNIKVGKSATRIAFEKEFAKNRKAGKKVFQFRGKSYNTKLAKG